MTFFLDKMEQPPQIKGRQPANERIPSWIEGLTAGYRTAQLENDSNFRAARERSMVAAERASRAADALGADKVMEQLAARGLVSPGTQYRPELIRSEGRARDTVLEMARQAAQADPGAWAEIDVTESGIEAEANARMQADYEDAQGILEMLPEGRFAAEFLGGMAGITADIKNLPFLIVGGGSGSILRVMGREAAINVAAEAVFLPSQFAQAERLDIPDPDVTTQLAMAAGAGAAFGGVIEAGRRGVTYWKARNRTTQPLTLDESMAVDKVEDALAGETDNPLRDAFEVARQETLILRNPINPERPPLIETSRLPPVDEPTPEPDTTSPGQFTDLSVFDRIAGEEDVPVLFDEQGMKIRALGYDDENPSPSGSFDEFHEITLKDGQKLSAHVRIDGNVLFIENIQKDMTVASAEDFNTVGIGPLRRILAAYKKLKPEIEYVEGVRVGGARKGGEYEGNFRTGTPARVKISTFVPRERPSPTILLTQQAEAAIAEADSALMRDFPILRYQPPLAQAIKAAGGIQWSRVNPNTGERELTWVATELMSRGVTQKQALSYIRKNGSASLDNLSPDQLGIEPGSGLRMSDDGLYLDRDDLVDAMAREILSGEKTPLSGEMKLRMDEIRSMGRTEATALDDWRAPPETADEFTIDRNAYLFDQGEDVAMARIAEDVTAYLRRTGDFDRLTEAERAEIVAAAQRDGGSVEYLVERAYERETDFWARADETADDIPWEDPARRGPADAPPRAAEPDARAAEPVQAEAGGAGARPGGDGSPSGAPQGQARIPGTDRVDTGQAQRDRATIAARQQQSRIGRLDQTRVEDDPGGLFGGAQRSLFDDPASKDARVVQDTVADDLRTQIDRDGDFEVMMDDGTMVPASRALDDLDAGDRASARLDLCGMMGAPE